MREKIGLFSRCRSLSTFLLLFIACSFFLLISIASVKAADLIIKPPPDGILPIDPPDIIDINPLLVSVSGDIRTFSGRPIPGVEVKFQGYDNTATTDASGHYTFNVSSGWTGWICVEKDGVDFEMGDCIGIIVPVTSPLTQNFTAIESIVSGTVRTASGAGLAGVTITFSNDGGTTTTESDGSYTQSVNRNWVGSVTPSKSGYSFTPEVASFTIDAMFHMADFRATLDDRTISGYVRTSSGTAIDGVTIDVSNHPGQLTTNSSGYYSIVISGGDGQWNHTLTPSKTGYTFSPPNRPYNEVTSNMPNQNFTGTLVQFTISGNVRTSLGDGIQGVTVMLSSGGGTATTDSSGNYSIKVNHGWSGTATPTKSGYTFDPPNQNFPSVTSDKTQNFVGTNTLSPQKTISGKVTEGGKGLGGVTITFSSGGGTATTDSSGNYSIKVNHGWSGTATPSKSGYIFTPPNISYSDVTGDRSSENYTANKSDQTYKLSVTIEGKGKVSINPNEESYVAGTLVELSAVAEDTWAFDSWSGMVADTDKPTTSVIMDSDLDIVATFTQDSDGDGVVNFEEQGPAGNDPIYDGNNDGVNDYLQNNCVSMHSYDREAYVSFEVKGGAFTEIKCIENPSPGNAPDGAKFPIGFYELDITNITSGGRVTVTLHLKDTEQMDTHFKYGPTPNDSTPHWYEFKYDSSAGTGAEIDGNTIKLHFVDGALGDSDLQQNGIIADKGGPSVALTATPGGDESGGSDDGSGDGGSGDDGGGGGCFIQSLIKQ